MRSLKWIIGVVFIFTLSARCQSVQSLLQPHQTFVDTNGNPCSGCLLFSYAAGTTTPQPTFTDSTGLVVNTNPVILDAAGGAQIWVNFNPYKFVLQTATGGSIWSVDHVTASSGGGGGGGSMVYPPPGLGASTGAAWRTPTYADVMALWSGCSGGGSPYLLYNGQCGTGGATLASNTFIGTQTLISSGVAFTPLVVRQTTGTATPTFRQQVDSGGTTVNFHALLAGDTIVVVVTQSDAGTTPVLSDTLGNVDTVAASTHLTGQGWLTVLTAPNPNPGTDVVSFSNTGSLASPYMVGYDITGLVPTSLVDTTATVQGASLASPQTSGSVTTSASDMVLTTLVAYANGGLSASSNYTNLLPSGLTNTSVSAYAVLPSGTYTSSWTNNAAGNPYSMVTVALKVSSSSTQTADLQQYQDNTGAVLARFDNVGGLHVPSCSGCGTGLTSNVTTGASISSTCGNLYFNQDATAGAAITATLPTPAANPACQVCIKNSNNGSAANTGTLEILVANTGTQSIIYNGSKSASGFIQSGGAAGDSACVIAISTTQWEAYPSTGVWTLH
jgi:hypothetical protein